MLKRIAQAQARTVKSKAQKTEKDAVNRVDFPPRPARRKVATAFVAAKREKKENAEEGEEKVERKPRRERKEVANDDEPREWTEGGLGGVSLSDLLNNN